MNSQQPLRGNVPQFQKLLTFKHQKFSKKYTSWYREMKLQNTGLFKTIVGVQLSSGNYAPNSGNSHHLTIPFEGDMHSSKRQGAYVSRN